MQEQIDDIQEQVTEMNKALTGDKLSQREGLIAAVRKNTKYRKGAAKRLTIVSGFFTACGAGLKWLFDF